MGWVREHLQAAKDRVDWARRFVGKITSGWHNGPKVEVVAHPGEIPVGARGVDVWGRYARGTAWICAHQPTHTLAQTLAHESIGHHGLRALLRGRWVRFMEGVHAATRDRKEGRLRKLVRNIKARYAGRDGRCRLSPIVLADELAAHVAGERTDAVDGRFNARRRVRVRFADMRKKLHQAARRPLKVGYDALVSMLKAAADRIKSRCARAKGMPRWQPRPETRPPKWRRQRRA